MEFILAILEQYGVDGLGIGLFVFFLRFFHDKQLKQAQEFQEGLIKFIKDGSQDIKHEQAVKKINKAIKNATRLIGLETRAIEKNPALMQNHINLAHAFRSIWLREWTEIMDTLYAVTYKGRPLQMYIHLIKDEWDAQREMILEDLKKAMVNQPTKIQQLETHLSNFKHELELGALQWLDTGVGYKQKVETHADEEQDVIIKEDAEKIG